MDVGLHGGLADAELVGDVGVGAAAGEGDQDLALALGQARDGTSRTASGSEFGCAAAGGPRAPLTDDDAGDLRVEDLLAGAHAVHGRDERGGFGVLEQERVRPGAQRTGHVLLVVERGPHEDRTG